MLKVLGIVDGSSSSSDEDGDERSSTYAIPPLSGDSPFPDMIKILGFATGLTTETPTTATEMLQHPAQHHQQKETLLAVNNIKPCRVIAFETTRKTKKKSPDTREPDDDDGSNEVCLDNPMDDDNRDNEQEEKDTYPEDGTSLFVIKETEDSQEEDEDDVYSDEEASIFHLDSDEEATIFHLDDERLAEATRSQEEPRIDSPPDLALAPPVAKEEEAKTTANSVRQNHFTQHVLPGLHRETVIEALLTRHLSSADAAIVENVMKILANLCHDDETRKYIAQAGGADAVAGAMVRHYESQGVAVAGCSAIQNLAFSQESDHVIEKARGVDVVVKAMKRFPDLELLQKIGCATLKNVTTDSHVMRRQVVDANGVVLILNAMKRFIDKGDTVSAACGALNNLLLLNDETKRRSIRKSIHYARGTIAITTAMKVHRDHATLQENAPMLMRKLE